MKFILSRNKDYDSHSKKYIVGHALLFWLVTRIGVMILMGIVMTIYTQFLGVDPTELTKFGGDPTVAKSAHGVIGSLLLIAIIAPIFEELVFRYGLSFKRTAVSISCACMTLFPLYTQYRSASMLMWCLSAVIAIGVFCAIYFATSENMWERLKNKWQIPAIYITSIAFGLVHLLAFSKLIFPYSFLLIAVPFFAGCSCAYLRVNMGFGWGVAMHVFNNIPGIIIILT